MIWLIRKFGRIDVLVNNAGNFFAGFFEELSAEKIKNQIETLLFGLMNVTRAVLPVLRKQRSGLVLTISSTAGITCGLFWALLQKIEGVELLKQTFFVFCLISFFFKMQIGNLHKFC